MRDNLRYNFREGKTETKIASGQWGVFVLARDIEMLRWAKTRVLKTLACRNGFGPLLSNGRQRVGEF